MTGPKNYRLMGMEPSPYSQKVASYLAFKGIECEWMNRGLKTEKLFQEHAEVQLIPMFFFPGGRVMQDSTPIIETLEAEHPTPSIHPEDKALWFLSYLFEEFGDEWCNKLMFSYRWYCAADQRDTSRRLIKSMLDDHWAYRLAAPLVTPVMVRRMQPKMAGAGANETSMPQLRASFDNLIMLLDRHFSARPYLLGARPCFGDFGLWGNLYQAWTNPTPKVKMDETAPHLVAWLMRMKTPAIEGGFEPLERLSPTLSPILQDEVGERFLAWVSANHTAWHAGEKEVSLTMHGKPYTQRTFKYQVETLDQLRTHYESVAGHTPLHDLMEQAGCIPYLSA